MKFSEMAYTRPDAQELKEQIAGLTRQLKEADSYETAREVFLKYDELGKHVSTLSSLASVHHSIDTRDAYYDAEAKFWNATWPELQEYQQAWTDALLESPYRPEFEAEYGELMFINAEIERKTFSPELIPQLQRENDLVQEYEKLLASAQVPFEGKTYTLSQMTPFKSDADDERRLAAWKAEGQWYKDNQEQLDGIFDELVHLRDQMGKTLGYENYLQLGYYRMGRNCYTKEDVEKFREAVQKYLVPVADGIYREQATRLGKEYPMSFADNALEFRSGNPRPCGTPDEILAQGRKFYDELSPETSEFFRMMLDNGLMDVLSTEGKEGGGYCTSFPDYGTPFIFANFNGTQGDVEVVTHEAGHAFAYYMNRDRVPSSTAWPGKEACAGHSKSMEIMALPWAEGFFGKDTEKFLYSHLSGALTFIPYGTMVDHFQHLVYEKPDMTPAERHGAWKELLGIYMPWQKLDKEIPFYAEGEGWQRQHHIYSYPLYYIDYCMAQTVSLEFWAMLQQDERAKKAALEAALSEAAPLEAGASLSAEDDTAISAAGPVRQEQQSIAGPGAWEHYMAYTRQGGSCVFTELLANAGLQSPFDEACLRSVCEEAQRWLKEQKVPA
ncbi:MAG: M3 family oligoendopeptidase [Lachnospiraceae bacterium]|nr:M3 family oligoendopeptidase [Lachnospiraceae bacterium]